MQVAGISRFRSQAPQGGVPRKREGGKQLRADGHQIKSNGWGELKSRRPIKVYERIKRHHVGINLAIRLPILVRKFSGRAEELS